MRQNKKQKTNKEELKKADNSSASFGLDSHSIKNNTEFKELFNNMKSCVAVYEARNKGRDFFFKDFNHAAEKSEKLKIEEVLGKNVKDVFLGVEKMGLLAVFRRVYKTGKSEDLPLKFYQDKKIFGWRNNFVYKLPSGEIVAIFEDVTEQKKLEESLEIKNFIFDNSLASNSIANTKGVIVEANRSFLDVWGFSDSKEVAGKSLAYFFNDQKEAVSILNKLNKTGKWSGDFMAKKKNGSTFIAYGTASKLINERGVLIGYQSSLFDISDRKKAEEETRESKSILDSIVHSTKDGILAVDMQGKIRFINDRFMEMWGVPQKIVDSSDDRQLLDFVLNQLTDSDEFLKKVKYLYKNNSKESLDMVYFKNGKIFERYSRPQKIGNKIIGRIWDFRDITSQKKSEDVIRLNEEKFEEIFNYSPIAIKLYNSKGELEKVNKATLEIFGLKSDKEILGFKLFDDPNIPENAKKSLKNGEAIEYENVFDFEKVRKFGLYDTKKTGTIQLATVITPIKKGSEGYLIMIEDITQDKESKMKLQEKLEEMEKMNKLMVGRELKMIELKSKLEEAALKTKK